MLRSSYYMSSCKRDVLITIIYDQFLGRIVYLSRRHPIPFGSFWCTFAKKYI